jgi:quercetin dioxygenase-like cupin family protein
MATIEFTSPESYPWVRTRDALSPDRHGDFTEGELDSEVRMHHPGGPEALQMYEVRARPGARFRPHAHDEDEILLVVEGELHAGAHVVGPGGTMYIPGGTLYAFSAGPEGVRLFNVRPRRDSTYITPEQLRARRAATVAAAADASAAGV